MHKLYPAVIELRKNIKTSFHLAHESETNFYILKIVDDVD